MKNIISLLLLFTIFVSCQSNDTEVEDVSVIDITNAIFTNTSTDCSNYSEVYESVVTDIQANRRYEGTVTIITGNENCQVSVNGIPNHDFNDESANFVTEVVGSNRIFTVSRNPQTAANITGLSQNYYDGVMLNGVVVDMLSAGCYRPNDPNADNDGNTPSGCTPNDPWLVDPLGTDSKFGADIHNAHTQPDGTYHYHASPNAMFDDEPGPNGSPLIGFASDGFPIYGSYFLDPQTNEVRKAISGYTLKQGARPGPNDNDPGGSYDGLYVDDYEFTNAGDLDECNGMSVNGSYGYYVTDSYPWILACHSGTVDESFNKAQGNLKVPANAWHHAH